MFYGCSFPPAKTQAWTSYEHYDACRHEHILLPPCNIYVWCRLDVEVDVENIEHCTKILLPAIGVDAESSFCLCHLCAVVHGSCALFLSSPRRKLNKFSIHIHTFFECAPRLRFYIILPLECIFMSPPKSLAHHSQHSDNVISWYFFSLFYVSLLLYNAFGKFNELMNNKFEF